MKRMTMVFLTVISLVMMLTSLTTAQEPEDAPAMANLVKHSDPESIYAAIQTARLAGDIETAMAYYADDAVWIALPPPPGSTGIFAGKEAIQAIMEDLYDRNFVYTYTDFQVHGNKAATTIQATEDVFTGLGIDPITFNGTSIINNGLVMVEAWVMSEEALAKFDEAFALVANEALFNRFIEELWHEGNLDVADELLREDFVSHAFPIGDRETLKEAVIGFRTDLPDGYFLIDELTITVDKIIARGSAVATPPTAGDEPERLDRFILTLSVADGQITERWVAFVPQ